MKSLEALLVLVAQGYVVRYFRAPQVLECWLLGPELDTIPFDRQYFEQVADAARAKEAVDRILHAPLLTSDAIESYGFRPDVPSETPAIEPESLNETGTLEVLWKGKAEKPGNRYRYLNVSRFHLQQFLKAESPWAYLTQVIQLRGCSRYFKVGDRPAVAADSVRLQLQQSIDAIVGDQPARTDSLQRLYDSAAPATQPEVA